MRHFYKRLYLSKHTNFLNLVLSMVHCLKHGQKFKRYAYSSVSCDKYNNIERIQNTPCVREHVTFDIYREI